MSNKDQDLSQVSIAQSVLKSNSALIKVSHRSTEIESHDPF